MPGRGFIIFSIFLLFFSEFSFRAKYERNSGLKFWFHFFGLSHPPVLARNNAGKRFYNFLSFFAIFFGILFPGPGMNRIRNKNFVFTFSAYLIPVSARNNAGKRFYNFLSFFTIVFGILFPRSEEHTSELQ